MDPFSASPANPQSLMNPLMGGQTPINGTLGIGTATGGVGSVNPSSIQTGVFQSAFSSAGPSSINIGLHSIHSANEPGSCFCPPKC